MTLNPFLALLLTFLIAVAWLRLVEFTAHRGWISSRLSRKIIHMGTGPVYVLCWLLFPEVWTARFLAALVPLAITAQFALVGTGVIKDEAAVKSMSRSGDRREILRGPLFYGIIFVALTLLYWKDSPLGIIALMLMCGGDGLADLIGRRFGTIHLPWNPTKTWAGSTGMYLGGWIFAVLVLWVYLQAGVFTGSLIDYLPLVTFIAVAGTFVESLPLRDVDNITVTAAALIVGHLLV